MRSLVLLGLSIVVLLVLTGCGEEGIFGALVITEGDHRFASTEHVRGEVVVAGGDVVLETGSQVSGSIHVLGGTLAAAGRIDGDLTVISGEVTLQPEAEISGDLVHGGGTLDRSPDVTVGGTSTTSGAERVPLSPAWGDRSLETRLQSLAITAIVPMAIAFLLLRIWPRPINRVSNAITDHAVVSGSLGLLSGVIGLVLAVFMIFTIVLIPIALVLLLLLGLVAMLGWVSLGYSIGRWLQAWRGWHISAPVAGVIGTALLTVVTHLVEVVPLVGALVPLVAVAIGFGAMLLTRFGTRRFVPQSYDVDEAELADAAA